MSQARGRGAGGRGGNDATDAAASTASINILRELVIETKKQTRILETIANSVNKETGSVGSALKSLVEGQERGEVLSKNILEVLEKGLGGVGGGGSGGKRARADDEGGATPAKRHKIGGAAIADKIISDVGFWPNPDLETFKSAVAAVVDYEYMSKENTEDAQNTFAADCKATYGAITDSRRTPMAASIRLAIFDSRLFDSIWKPDKPDQARSGDTGLSLAGQYLDKAAGVALWVAKSFRQDLTAWAVVVSEGCHLTASYQRTQPNRSADKNVTAENIMRLVATGKLPLSVHHLALAEVTVEYLIVDGSGFGDNKENKDRYKVAIETLTPLLDEKLQPHRVPTPGGGSSVSAA